MKILALFNGPFMPPCFRRKFWIHSLVLIVFAFEMVVCGVFCGLVFSFRFLTGYLWLIGEKAIDLKKKKRISSHQQCTLLLVFLPALLDFLLLSLGWNNGRVTCCFLWVALYFPCSWGFYPRCSSRTAQGPLGSFILYPLSLAPWLLACSFLTTKRKVSHCL